MSKTPTFLRILCSILAGFSLLAAGCSSKNPSNPTNPSSPPGGSSGGLLSKLTETTVVLPERTPITVTVDETLTSSKSQSGDSFEASTAEPVTLNDKTVIPKGAKVKGRVVEASPSGRLEHPGKLSIELTSVEVGGKTYDLTTSMISRQAGSHRNRDLEFIGGGAAGGALIGALVGHGKGAAIGAAVGAGGGTAGAALTGKKDVSIPAETVVTFHLKQPVSVTVKD